jgi:hypothetical protein
VDDSEVTLNVCLGKEFSGGELFFRGSRCEKHVNTGTNSEVSHGYGITLNNLAPLTTVAYPSKRKLYLVYIFIGLEKSNICIEKGNVLLKFWNCI